MFILFPTFLLFIQSFKVCNSFSPITKNQFTKVFTNHDAYIITTTGKSNKRINDHTKMLHKQQIISLSSLSFTSHSNIYKKFEINNSGTFSTILQNSISNNENNNNNNNNNNNEIIISSATSTRIYFDIQINEEDIGRLVFYIDTSTILSPSSTTNSSDYVTNIIQISKGARTAIDPKCQYTNCAFLHSPQFVEGFPQYRWTHILNGNGRNAIGRSPTDRLILDSNTRSHYINGCGHYYGMSYIELVDTLTAPVPTNPYGVYLSVPLVGPYRGLSSFSIVRVDESPQEWRERLLLNSVVLGTLESGIETLHTMARQTSGPPVVIRSGVLS